MKFTLYTLVVLALLIGLAHAKPAEEAQEKSDSPPKETERKAEEKSSGVATGKHAKGASSITRSSSGDADQPNIVREFVAFPVNLVKGGLNMAGALGTRFVSGFSNGLKGLPRYGGDEKKE